MILNIDHSYASPNYNDRRNGAQADMILIHYTGMPTAKGALERLCDAEAQVSAHYLIEKNGKIWQMVDEDKRAWHAGVSSWQGVTDINSCSIGIELENGGHEIGYELFPDEQIETLIVLCRDIMTRRNITPQRVIGHEHVAPGRKLDPGPTFPWERLADAGIAIGRLSNNNQR